MEGVGIKSTTNGAAGDSGGPVFRETYSGLYIINIVNLGAGDAGTSACESQPITERVIGYPAHILNGFWGVKFDT